MIEKAVYADTPQNRKLGRVGQEYHRGNGKKEQETMGQKQQVPEKFKNCKNTEFIDFSDCNNSPNDIYYVKMSKKVYDMFPKGKQFKDAKGNVWTVDKHDKNTENIGGTGYIRLRNEKKKVHRITAHDIALGIAPKGTTTGIKELDDFARKNFKDGLK